MRVPTLLVVCVVMDVAKAQRLRFGTRFADKLFAGSMQFANRSLHGRFIQELAAGTLPKAVFRRDLYQDGLFLSKYARAIIVMAARAEQADELIWLSNKSIGYLHGHDPNPGAGFDDVTFERYAGQAILAYTSFILQAAWSENRILAYAAVLPCQRLYDWLFDQLKKISSVSADSPYKTFIEQYADPPNRETTIQMQAFMDRYAAHGVSANLFARAQMYYNRAMQYEIEFFEQAFQEFDVAKGALAQQLRSLRGSSAPLRVVHGKVWLANSTIAAPSIRSDISWLFPATILALSTSAIVLRKH